MLWFADKYKQNCIAKAGLFGAGYQGNGNYLCTINKHGHNNYERYIQLSFTHVCEYLNERVRIVGVQNGKSFKGFSKKLM